MIIQLKIKPPVDVILGLSKTPQGVNVDIEISSVTNLISLFEELAKTYPGFHRLTQPTDDLYNNLLIAIDDEFVLDPIQDQVRIHDRSTVFMIVRYQGG